MPEELLKHLEIIAIGLKGCERVTGRYMLQRRGKARQARALPHRSNEPIYCPVPGWSGQKMGMFSQAASMKKSRITANMYGKSTLGGRCRAMTP